ncbi:MAG: hypothetical protein OEZ01_18095 [Candidatus Heimdallarchaeota archaeon]|nr:hypothetical protein [Candidatus Heimdallarchaeota archaeon]
MIDDIDSDEDIVQLVSSRFKSIDSDIFYYLELPSPTLETRKVFFHRLMRIIQKDGYYLIFDTTKIDNRSSAESRQFLIQQMKKMPRCNHLSIICIPNSIIEASMKFIFASLRNLSYSITDSYDLALNSILNIKNQQK